MKITIKPGTAEHFAALREIEIASFETLRLAGAVTGPATASDDSELQNYLNAQLLYVAFNTQNEPLGYAGAYIDEGWLHIAEIDVHPDWQRRGIGRQLMNVLLSEAQTRNLKGATLTTDSQAAFNAPFYASLKFQIIEKNECPPRLKAILDAEKAKGLNPHRRVAMVVAF